MKYNLLFKLSFIMYILVLFAAPYISAQNWADIIALIFCVTVCYQVLYLFYLRKKDKLKFIRVLGQFFLYLLLSLELWTILACVDLAVNGCIPTDFLGNQIGERVYGWEAITEDGFGFYIYKIILLVATIYQFIYALVLIGMKKGDNKYMKCMVIND